MTYFRIRKVSITRVLQRLCIRPRVIKSLHQKSLSLLLPKIALLILCLVCLHRWDRTSTWHRRSEARMTIGAQYDWPPGRENAACLLDLTNEVGGRKESCIVDSRFQGHLGRYHFLYSTSLHYLCSIVCTCAKKNHSIALHPNNCLG